MIKKWPAGRQAGVANILLIIFGLAIAAVLIGFFTERGNLKNSALSPVKTPAAKCGLIVKTPSEGAEVSSPIHVAGTINGCGWTAFEAVAGTVTAFGTDGEQLSAVTPLIAVGEWMKESVDFSASLVLTAKPANSNLKLIFRNENSSGEPARDKSFELKVKVL